MTKAELVEENEKLKADVAALRTRNQVALAEQADYWKAHRSNLFKEIDSLEERLHSAYAYIAETAIKEHGDD